MMTIPDVQVAENILPQVMASPKPKHWAAVKRVLQYFAGTQKHEVLIRKSDSFNIIAYCDSEWGGDTVDRKSWTGFLVFIVGTLVSWMSRKYNTLARSSTKAVYRAVVVTTQEVEAV